MGRNNFPEDTGMDKILSVLQDRIERLERASRGSTATEGGSVEYIGTDFVVRAPWGQVLFKVGVLDDGDWGVVAYRDEGTKAFEVARYFGQGTGTQKVSIYDSNGYIIHGDSSKDQGGFDSPFIPHYFRPADRSDAKTTTSASFVTLFKANSYRQNPGLPIKFHVLCSDGTTAGEVQVSDGTNILGPWWMGSPWVGNIPAGTTTETIITAPSLHITHDMGDEIELQVQVRRTAGTGTVSVGIANPFGRELT